jgi:uncharacterized protein (TIGR00297 family)
MPPLLALGLSLAIAAGGWATRALTRTGTAAATLIGSLILWRTGWPGMAALGAFFIGSSLISRLAPDRSVTALDAKGSTRDAWQVMANGGAAALGAILSRSDDAALWVVTASLAGAAADTWATSCGGWSRKSPRHILTWMPVPPGTSGGITVVGTAGALAGAATVGAAAALSAGRLVLFPLSLVVGMLGMTADSIIGAAWQGRFHCPACGLATERSVHRCGSPTTAAGGLAWLTNDGVNGLATGFAAVLGYGLFLWAVGRQCCGP